MIAQRTLKNVIRAKGVGLHTGEKVFITLRPAPVDHGVVFRRVDLEPPVVIPALGPNIGETAFSSTLVADRGRIATIEHLMAALCGLGIDNVLIDVSAGELPIMDGSAAPFVFLLQSAGIEDQPAPKRFLRVTDTVSITDGDVTATLSPYDGFRVEYTLLYDHPVFEQHTKTSAIDVSTTSFIKEISRARTFGFLADLERLRDMNLARGGSLANAVVLDHARILNEGGLRLEDEFVKHKILDVIGDLYLLGHPLIGAFSGYKSGHGPNNLLVREVLKRTDAWELVTFEDELVAPQMYARASYG